jgi:Xaa-Pro dipeptidase
LDENQRLNADLPRHFEKLRDHFDAHPDITGAELFTEAERLAETDGWLWGGQIAGHLVGEFPHYRIPGDKDLYRISPHNPSGCATRMPRGTGSTGSWRCIW